jgi:predicted amidohydrolase YtcJ
MSISHPAGQPGADLVIRHAAIHPFTSPGRLHSALAVRDGMIVATHDEPHGLDGLVASQTTLLDEPGSAILPAFFDTHNHQLLAARDGELADLDSATTLDELIGAIRDQAKRTPPGHWVVTSRSWHESNLREERLPTAAELDAASTKHPILVRRGGHVVIANSMALQEAVIGRGTPDPERGTMVRDPSGQPTGVFIEQPAFQALERLIPALSPDDQVRLLGSQCRRYNAKGIATIRDPGLTPDEIAIYQQLHNRGGLTTRTRILMWAATVDQARSVLHQVADLHLDNDMLRIDGLKVVVDGGIEGAALSTGYRSNPGYTGHLLVPADELLAIVDHAASQGWRVACHAVGDRAIRTVIDTYASVLERHEQIPPRNLSLEHAILADADSRQKAAALGITVTVQHSLLYALAGNMRSYWGDERTASANPVNSWLQAGAHLAAGSDCNVAPYNPLLGIWGLITRGTRSAGVQGPTEAIDIYRAFELYTSAATWVTGEEALAGTIQPGHRADLAIFRSDPLLAPVDTLPQFEPVCTLLGGRAVFDPEGLLPSATEGVSETPR